MTLITDSIKYNVRERGRKFRGVDRNFDTAALAALINGPSVQEKVQHGDMLGYLGHWPRVKFGMEVCEGGVDPATGKAVALPVAIRTVELAAEPDGTITHKAEFLDTEAGEIAAGLYRSKAGGFSSAIDTLPRTNPAVPRGFYGFDFVFEPNYSTNRGHKVTLDSVEHGAELVALLDSALAQASMAEDELLGVFDALHAQHLDTLDAMERMVNERDDLLDRLAALTGTPRTELDSIIAGSERVAPARVRRADIGAWRDERNAQLAELSELPKDKQPVSPEVAAAYQRYTRG